MLQDDLEYWQLSHWDLHPTQNKGVVLLVFEQYQKRVWGWISTIYTEVLPSKKPTPIVQSITFCRNMDLPFIPLWIKLSISFATDRTLLLLRYSSRLSSRSQSGQLWRNDLEEALGTLSVCKEKPTRMCYMYVWLYNWGPRDASDAMVSLSRPQ